MDFCFFDSRLTTFKSPFGAVPAGSKVQFSVCLPKQLCASLVELVLFGDEQEKQSVALSFQECDLRRNRYSASVSFSQPQLLFYYFRITEDNGNSFTLHADEFMRAVCDASCDRCWQLTVYDPSMQRPTCLGNGIMYQIFPDRFCCSGTVKQNVPSDRTLRRDWGNLPVYLPDQNGEITNSDYFCGDLQGIAEHLEYLKKLGVTCLYLNPIFEAHSNHRYNTADYRKIDPLLGTEDDFSSLCSKAKQLGISVILDGVFSHTGSDSVYFNKNGRYGEMSGAYRDPNSRYRSWYSFRSYPDDYESWWGFLTLPNVKETLPDYLDFICNPQNGVLAKWLSLGASGFRLDVADELPDKFLNSVHQTVKGFGADKLVLGEVWEDASNKISYGKRRRYLLGNQLDSVMNYPFRTAILEYIRNGSEELFQNNILSVLEHYPPAAINSLMNPLSTHDTPRAITMLVGEDMDGKDRQWQAEHHYLSQEDYERGQVLLKLACVLQYFLPGIPCLYYGDEAGLSGYADPFNRCCYPWGYENHNLIDWFSKLGQLRLSLPFLTDASFTPVALDSELCCYLRQGKEQEILVAVNRGERERFLPVPAHLKDSKIIPLVGNISDNLLQPNSAAVLIRFPFHR